MVHYGVRFFGHRQVSAMRRSAYPARPPLHSRQLRRRQPPVGALGRWHRRAAGFARDPGAGVVQGGLREPVPQG